MDADQALKQIATYQYGQSRKPLIVVAEEVRDSYSNSERRKFLRKALAALLSSDATIDCKRFVCEQLSIIGTGEEVPALAKLLTDEEMSHVARIALERIPDPAADAALRDALDKAKGKILIGVINSLGVRRDRGAVGALVKLMADGDERVAEAAAAALGKIGGLEAADALAKAKGKASPKVRATVVDSLLRCAERFLDEGKKDIAAKIYSGLCSRAEVDHVRASASRGLEKAQSR